MSIARFPSGTPSAPLWQVLYQVAILEFDNDKLPRRIFQARNAIHDRAQEILNDSSERQLLDNALRTLARLEKKTAKKQSA